MKTRDLSLDQLLEQSPNCDWLGGAPHAFYSVHCCWWTSFPDDIGNTGDFRPASKMKIVSETGIETEVTPAGLPCCPHCGSVLMQAHLEEFIKHAKANEEHYGPFGLDAFVRSHSRNSKTCYKDWNNYFFESKKSYGKQRFA